jgi:hypothetical protein
MSNKFIMQSRKEKEEERERERKRKRKRGGSIYKSSDFIIYMFLIFDSISIRTAHTLSFHVLSFHVNEKTPSHTPFHPIPSPFPSMSVRNISLTDNERHEKKNRKSSSSSSSSSLPPTLIHLYPSSHPS